LKGVLNKIIFTFHFVFRSFCFLSIPRFYTIFLKLCLVGLAFDLVKSFFYLIIFHEIFKTYKGGRPTATTSNSYGASNNRTSVNGGSMGRSQPVAR
jgi:hypothetical protein